jgi:PilZ domain
MRRERRKSFRVEWNSPATIYDGKSARPCIVSNFSNGGAKITGVRASTIPDEFALRITSHDSRIRKCCVLWRSDDTLRVEFTDSIKRAEKRNLKQMVREPTP